MTLAANHRCSFCTPGRDLGTYRCPECLRIYELHLAAEVDPDAERRAVAWIREAAPKLRCQIKMPTTEWTDDALASDRDED